MNIIAMLSLALIVSRLPSNVVTCPNAVLRSNNASWLPRFTKQSWIFIFAFILTLIYS